MLWRTAAAALIGIVPVNVEAGIALGEAVPMPATGGRPSILYRWQNHVKRSVSKPSSYLTSPQT